MSGETPIKQYGSTEVDTSEIYGRQSEIFYSEPTFIVVGNFSLQQDRLTHDPYSAKSGLSDESFAVLVADFCQNSDVDIEYNYGDTIILSGHTQDAYKRLQTEMGHRFSYALTNAQSVESIVDIHENGPDPDYVPTEFSATPFSFD